jgi:hypothetical protein
MLIVPAFINIEKSKVVPEKFSIEIQYIYVALGMETVSRPDTLAK